MRPRKGGGGNCSVEDTVPQAQMIQLPGPVPTCWETTLAGVEGSPSGLVMPMVTLISLLLLVEHHPRATEKGGTAGVVEAELALVIGGAEAGIEFRGHEAGEGLPVPQDPPQRPARERDLERLLLAGQGGPH